VNQIEASFLDRLESVQMKAELLSMYVAATGNPDYLNEDLARYKAIDPGDIQAMTATYLRGDGCVILSVFPLGKPELAAPKEGRP
jgi:zinc protease